MTAINIFLTILSWIFQSPTSITTNSFSNTSEGFVRIHLVNLEADTIATVRDYNFGIWFKGQTLIVENVVVKFELMPDKNSKPAYLKPFSFVYYDSKNSKAQSYSAFNAALKPEVSFVVKDSEYFTYDFLGKVNYPVDSTFEIADTIIAGNNFKRRVSEHFYGPDEHVKHIAYLKKDDPKMPVHLTPGFDRIFSPYRAYRVESFFNDKLVRIEYMDERSTKLNLDEKKVFETWKKNMGSSIFSSTVLEFKKFYANKWSEEFIQENSPKK